MRRFILLSSLLAIGCGAPNIPEMPALEASTAKPAIFDHDGCIDDYVALLMLLASEKYNLQAVTVAYGDGYREPSLEACGRILGALGKQARLGGYPDGLEGRNKFPEEWRRQSIAVAALPALAEFDAQSPSGDAVAVLEETLAQSQELVTIFATGPLTNLAEVYSRSPELVAKTAQVVIMGGAVRVAGNTILQSDELTDLSAEYNFFVDPPATKAVFALADIGLRITLVPLDATNALPIKSPFVDQLLAAPGRHAKLSGEVLKIVRHEMNSWEYYLWDGAAVLAAVEPGLFTFENLSIKIHTEGRAQGRSEESSEGAGPIRVATGVQPNVEPLAAVLKLLNN